MKREFEYRPSLWKTAALTFLAAGGFVILSYAALFFEGPIIILGIQLNQAQVRILAGVAAALSTFGIVALSTMLYAAMFSQSRVVVDGSLLIVPKSNRLGISDEEIQIPAETIHSIQIKSFIGKTKVLRIEHATGTTTIVSNMFPDPRSFDQLVSAINEDLVSSQRRS